jgi:hypothetical protein
VRVAQSVAAFVQSHHQGFRLPPRRLRNQRLSSRGSLRLSPSRCIPLCLQCHGEVEAYNSKHPIGTKYTPTELKRRRDEWYQALKHPIATTLNPKHVNIDREMVKRLRQISSPIVLVIEMVSVVIEYVKSASVTGLSSSLKSRVIAWWGDIEKRTQMNTFLASGSYRFRQCPDKRPPDRTRSWGILKRRFCRRLPNLTSLEFVPVMIALAPEYLKIKRQRIRSYYRTCPRKKALATSHVTKFSGASRSFTRCDRENLKNDRRFVAVEQSRSSAFFPARR